MDFSLNKNSLDYYKVLGTKSVSGEFTAEAVVPDTQEDILRILCADACTAVHAKDISGGRVTVSGDAAVKAIYVPESEKCAAAIETKIPFSIDVDFQMTGELYPIVSVSVTALDVRVLNPRKILARCEVRIECTGYAKDELVWFDALSEDCQSVHIHTAERQIDAAALVSEKTFTAGDELTLPPGKPAPESILCSSVSLRAEDNQIVGEKLIVKGSAVSRIFYLPADSGDLEYAEFETPFSMLMEIPDEKPDSVQVTALMTESHIDIHTSQDGLRTLELDLQGAAQAVFLKSYTISSLDDAYSTAGELTAETSAADMETASGTDVFRTSQRWQLDMPVHACDIIGSVIIPGAAVCSEGTLSAPAAVSVVYRGEDGKLYGVRETFCASAEYSGGQPGSLGVEYGAVLAVPAGDCADLRVSADFSVSATRREHLVTLSALAQEDDKLYTAPRPSLTVIRADTDDLWSIAKRYVSSEKMIADCNGLQEDEKIAGRTLLIPRV